MVPNEEYHNQATRGARAKAGFDASLRYFHLSFTSNVWNVWPFTGATL